MVRESAYGLSADGGPSCIAEAVSGHRGVNQQGKPGVTQSVFGAFQVSQGAPALLLAA